MFITIQNTGGNSLGPYDVYYDAVDPGLLLASNVSSSSLAAGLNLTVSNAATSIIVVNTRTGCGNTQQVLTLPPPVTPLTYESVTVSAKLGEDIATATTASVYYKIDNSSYFLLGSFHSGSCDSFTSIPVPTNSTIFLGIVSGSTSIAFSATGSNAICTGAAGVTEYCGISTPFSLTITGSRAISMSAKVNSTTKAIVPCNVPPPPPPPPPVNTGDPTVAIKGSVAGDLNTRVDYTVTRIRNGVSTILYQQLNTNVLPTDLFNTTTIPNIQPSDSIQISIQSATTPLTEVRLRVLGAATPTSPLVQIYRTTGFNTADSYTINIPATGDSYYSVEAYSN